MGSISGINSLYPAISTSHTRVINGGVVFAREYIWLNGHKVKIGGSLSDTARALNRHSVKTGIRAVVVNAGTSNERLKLIIRGNNLTINDPKGVLSGLYKGKKIGTSDDMLIQIASPNKSKVNFTYGNSIPEKNLTQGHIRLSESATKPLVVKKLLQNLVHDVPDQVQGVQDVHYQVQDVHDQVQVPRDLVDAPNIEEVQDVVEDPAIRQEYLRRSREIMEQAIDRSHKEFSEKVGQNIVAKVIEFKKLTNTTTEQIELTERVAAEEIYTSEVGEEFLRHNFDLVLDRLSKRISDNRDKLSSAFSDKLEISEPNIRKAARTVLQEIKSEQCCFMAQDILKGFGKITVLKYDKLSNAITNGLNGGRELSFDTVYNSYPKVKERISELVLQSASRTRLSRGELFITDTRIERLQVVTSDIKIIDLGLV